MRVFLAIGLPDGVRGRLADAAAGLAPVAEGVKWVRAETLHLTLVFFRGGMGPADVERAGDAAGAVCAAARPFSCSAEGLGFWGRCARPVCIWAGVAPSPALESLGRRLAAAALRLGFDVDTRPFRPHITLGRCKKPVPNRRLLRAVEQGRAAAFGRFEVSRVTFYESRLTPLGPEYRAMREIPLGQGPGQMMN